jgi:hypothetical protein
MESMLTVPDRIGRYEIKGRLAAGGMGSLYLARDTNPTTERLVALKLLRASFDSDEVRERFAREAQALAELSHPNIVTIHDSGEYDDSPFMVMEYVRGETLAECIKRRAPMPLGRKLRLLAELCDGLAHAHEAGIIHRDIKPANLMVDVHGRLKILDFGIVRVLDASVSSRELTRANMGIGTPGYMSPEQVRGGLLDARSDVFAVGAVAFELVSYREAFSGSTTEVASQVASEEPVARLAELVGVDAELAAVIGSALEKSLDRRCQSAQSLGDAFARIRARLGDDDRASRPTPAPSPGVERRTRRERAADVAYQRAAGAHADGADGFARRSAIEALAEDPLHQDARRLVGELGGLKHVEPWLPRSADAPLKPPPSAPPAAPIDMEQTLVSRGSPLSDDSTGPLPVLLPAATPAPAAAGVPAGEPPPAAGNGPATPESTPLSAPKAKVATPARPRPKGAGRHAWLALAAVAVVLVGVAAAALFLRSGGELLTITRPSGGTVRTDQGIDCGTNATACVQERPQGTTVQLQAVPDRGFVFSTWTGDCASGGATLVMSSPRACGAVFSPETPPAEPQGAPPAQAQAPDERPASGAGEQPASDAAVVAPAPVTLTIAKPAGGTIIGPGIKCGAGGSQCESRQPAGSPVVLTYLAEKGFTFGGFTGDCSASGKTRLTEPRRCGATFLKAAAAPARVQLTITKPTGGTVTGAGINCGSGGTQCSAEVARDSSVALKALPDAGFTFVAFTGDCDASGAAVMSAARTCGASFTAAAAAPAAPAAGWTTNLPETTVTLKRDEKSITLTFGGRSPYAGYTAVLTGNGRQFSGDATRPGCPSASRIEVTVAGEGVLTGQFQLRACTGRGVTKTGMVLYGKR